MFVKTTNDQIDQYPYTVGDLRRDYPNTSFSKRLSDETMAAYGMFPVEHDETPSYDRLTQRIVHSNEPVLKDGKWLITKTVVALTPEQIADKNEAKAKEVRSQRNVLLTDTDWTQVADAPVDATAWATYRQALRDITTHVNWPHLEESDWPVKPQ